MRNSVLAGVCAAVVLGGAASAQDRPRYLPTRDVTVQYQVTSSQPGAPASVVAHISASGQVRLDAGDKGVVLYDSGSGHARWVLPQGGLYIDLPVGASLAGALIPPAGAQFTRTGTGSVAGLRCTDWQVSMPKGSGTACVTADGVILSGRGSDARGHTGSIVATSVTQVHAAQPAALFAPPPDAKHLELPHNLSFARPPAP